MGRAMANDVILSKCEFLLFFDGGYYILSGSDFQSCDAKLAEDF